MHRSLTLSLRDVMLFSVLLTLLGGLGCSSSVKKLQREVGMRSRQIKLADLGKRYVKLRDSEYNIFARDAKPVRIKYRTFKLKKFDAVTKRANIIYAKFKFAQGASRQFNTLVDRALKRGFKGESRRSLRKALRRKSAKGLKSRKRLADSYGALEISLKASRELLDEAKKMLDESKKVSSNTTKVLKNKPDKVILADKVLSESKRSAERLMKVIKGAPKLVKSLGQSVEISKIARAAGR